MSQKLKVVSLEQGMDTPLLDLSSPFQTKDVPPPPFFFWSDHVWQHLHAFGHFVYFGLQIYYLNVNA